MRWYNPFDSLVREHQHELVTCGFGRVVGRVEYTNATVGWIDEGRQYRRVRVGTKEVLDLRVSWMYRSMHMRVVIKTPFPVPGRGLTIFIYDNAVPASRKELYSILNKAERCARTIAFRQFFQL